MARRETHSKVFFPHAHLSEIGRAQVVDWINIRRTPGRISGLLKHMKATIGLCETLQLAIHVVACLPPQQPPPTCATNMPQPSIPAEGEPMHG